MKKMFGLYAFLALVGFVSFVFAFEVTKQDSKFMMQAASSDMMEIATSNMALQKSQNEDVRRFAQMMIDDHSKTSDQLRSIAATKNVTLPAEMDAKHRSMADKLAGVSGDRFDMEYMKMQVKAHEAAVKLFQSESNKGSDADVKGFASANLPALQTHLNMARTMSGGMKSGGGNGNGSNRNSNSGNMNSNSDNMNNMNMNSNSGNMNNMNMNSNRNSNSNRGNSNTNNNRNRNNNSNSNTNGNTNSNMNSNSNRR
jgi:putative membrane protein